MINNPSNLPADIAPQRVLDTAQACELVNISIPHWRRMYRTGAAPKPIKLGARKFGWKACDLIAWLDRRQAA